MKKLLLVCIFIVGIVLAGGCIESQTNQKSYTPILNLSDIPEFELDYYTNLAVPKSAYCTFSLSEFEVSDITGYCDNKTISYDENIPDGYRFIGSRGSYSNKDGDLIEYEYRIFDRTSDDLSKDFDRLLELSGVNNTAAHQLTIGDHAVWIEYPGEKSSVRLYYTYKNSFVMVHVNDEKEKSLNEAIKIGNIAKRRLD